ncbi:MAG: TonB-dependent receptor [Flavobacteriales bacterium]|nr:TonB-dependent receptor [Flavobacteriales bacterium]
MKNVCRFVLLILALLCSDVAFAQFGGGPGGFGGGPGVMRPGGGPGGYRPSARDRQQGMTNVLAEDEGRKIGSVNGTVINILDQKPVEYATVSVIDTKTGKVATGGITNFKGAFNIKQIPEGEYKVVVTYIGYEDYTSSPITLSNKNRHVDLSTVYLEEKIEALDEVTITPEFSSIENRIDKQVVNIGRDMITGGAMARDVFENLPMVDVDFDGNVELQGSSVKVLLNNRPTDMSVADLLESIPAEIIDKVELITNPSAKQDPDGVGGIINIITKRGMSMYGYTFNTRLGIDTKGKMNGGLNFSTYSGKFLYSLSYNFNFSEDSRDNETYRAEYRTTAARPNPYLNYQFGESESSRMNHYVKASIDYLPNKKNAFSYNISVGPRRSDSEGVSSSYFLPLDVAYDDITKEIAQEIVAEYAANMDPYFNRYRENASENKSLSVQNALTFRRDMSDYEYLEVDVSHDFNDNKGYSQILNTVSGNAGGRLTTDDVTDNHTYSHLLSARVDYSKEVRGTSKFEVGTKADFTWRDMPYFYYIDNIPDMQRSNHFKYDQQLISLYATYARYVGNFTLQVGLRGEQTIYHTLGLGVERDGSEIIYSESKDVSLYRDYFSLFPSAGVMYKFGSNNTLSLNYSRRVTRPNVMTLNPSYRFDDPMYVTVGNPYLDPSFTNSLLFRYNKRLSNKGFLGLNVSYRNSTDQVERITTRVDPTDPTKPEGDVLYTTSANIGSSYNISAGLMFSYRPFKFWNISFNAQYVYRETDIPDRTNYIKSAGQYSLRLNNNFSIPETKTRIQFRLNYNGPRTQLQGKSEATLVASMGVSQNFLKDKLNASIRVNDLFNSMRSNSNTYGDDYVMFNNNRMNRQVVSFTVSYRISEIKFKDKRAKGLGGGEQELAPDTAPAAQ